MLEVFIPCEPGEQDTHRKAAGRVQHGDRAPLRELGRGRIAPANMGKTMSKMGNERGERKGIAAKIETGINV